MIRSIDWREVSFLKILKRYFIPVFIVSVIFGLVGMFGYTKLKVTEYSSSSELVQNDNNYNLITSYKQFVESDKYRSMINAQIDQSSWKNYTHKNDYTAEIDNKTSSPFFSINISSENSNYAKFVSATAAQIFVNNIGKFLSGANISLVQRAKTATVVSKKNDMIIAGMGIFILVFIISFLIIVLYSWYIGNVQSEDYLEKIIGLNKIAATNLSREKE
ncbi:hypothetical protein C6Y09_06850 [Lactiplantibacillus pentosus]|nr:hypothetical protein C6Y09_06850 [Lactiplantibacillus pentosus]